MLREWTDVIEQIRDLESKSQLCSQLEVFAYSGSLKLGNEQVVRLILVIRCSLKIHIKMQKYV